MNRTRGPTSIDSAGAFTANLGRLAVVAEANSLGNGSLVVNDVVLKGRIKGGDRFCSTFAGKLPEPHNYTFLRRKIPACSFG